MRHQARGALHGGSGASAWRRRTTSSRMRCATSLLVSLGSGKVAAVAGEQSDDVGVEVEAGAFGGDVVGDDQVGVLGGEFLACVFSDVIGFGGKTHDQWLLPLSRGDVGENVGGRFERNRQRIAALLDFVADCLRGAIVGDSGGKNGNRAGRQNRSTTARCISAAVRTSMRSTPAGVSSAVGPADQK